MSIDFGAYLRQGSGFVQSQIPLRAQIQEARIVDNERDVEFKRNGIDLDPQTVRIEYDDTVTVGRDGIERHGVIFGIHGHPELPDTDIKRWDTFIMDDMEFTVTFVNHLLHGQIQAHFEAVRS